MPTIPVLVCALESWFVDDVRGLCERCDQAIYFRPHAPRQVRYVCLRCFSEAAEAETEMYVTEASLRELAAWFDDRKRVH